MENPELFKDEKTKIDQKQSPSYVYCSKAYATLKSHKEFYNAKNAVWKSARKIVSDLFDPKEIEPILNEIKNTQLKESLLIVPVIKENNNDNKMPFTYAEKLRDHFFKNEIKAVNITNIFLESANNPDIPKRKTLDAAKRLLMKPIFKGPVVKGGNYLT